jgi:hypothetical protein
MWRIRIYVEMAGGWFRFLTIVAGIALVLGWIAWAVYDNGGVLCGPTTGGYCHHGKVTP